MAVVSRATRVRPRAASGRSAVVVAAVAVDSGGRNNRVVVRSSKAGAGPNKALLVPRSKDTHVPTRRVGAPALRSPWVATAADSGEIAAVLPAPPAAEPSVGDGARQGLRHVRHSTECRGAGNLRGHASTRGGAS